MKTYNEEEPNGTSILIGCIVFVIAGLFWGIASVYGAWYVLSAIGFNWWQISLTLLVIGILGTWGLIRTAKANFDDNGKYE